jgi:hypothetical protein
MLRFTVDDMVARPASFSLAELRSYPSSTQSPALTAGLVPSIWCLRTARKRASIAKVQTADMRASLTFFPLALLLPGVLAWGQSGTTVTTSSSRTQTFHTTNTTAEVDNFVTRLTARIGSGPLLYDQTFNVQLSDPTVQAAIQQARIQLANAGAISINGPNQTTNVKTLTGTSQSTVVNSTQITTDIGVENTLGPGTILIGDRGLCTGLTGTAPTRLPTGCPGGTSFIVVAGTANINANTNIQSDIFQTVTTTSTFQIAQTYELNGATGPLPATPAPPSVWLTLIGLAAAGATSLKRKWRNSGAG